MLNTSSLSPPTSSSTLECLPSNVHASKEFLLKTFKVNYDNRYSVEHVEAPAESSSLVITNYVCRRVGERVFKKTEIRIGHQLIILEDSYQFENLPSLLPETPTKPEIELETSASIEDHRFKHIEETSTEENCEKRDRKNVVKNIVKAFESWLRQELSQEIYRENTSLQNSRKTLERMVAKVKFNNRLINNLIKNQNLNSMFERFLRDHASEWLEQSKIKDRVSHKEAIEAFLKASASNLPVYLKPQIEVEVLWVDFSYYFKFSKSSLCSLMFRGINKSNQFDLKSSLDEFWFIFMGFFSFQGLQFKNKTFVRWLIRLPEETHKDSVGKRALGILLNH